MRALAARMAPPAMVTPGLPPPPAARLNACGPGPGRLPCHPLTVAGRRSTLSMPRKAHLWRRSPRMTALGPEAAGGHRYGKVPHHLSRRHAHSSRPRRKSRPGVQPRPVRGEEQRRPRGWYRESASSVVDWGGPVRPAATVSGEGTKDGLAAGPLNGWSVIEAPDADMAARLLQNHPFIILPGRLRLIPPRFTVPRTRPCR